MLENCFSNICGPTRGCHTHYHGSLSTHAPIDIDDIIYSLAANKADTEPERNNQNKTRRQRERERDILANKVRIINAVKGFQ